MPVSDQRRAYQSVFHCVGSSKKEGRKTWVGLRISGLSPIFSPSLARLSSWAKWNNILRGTRNLFLLFFLREHRNCYIKKVAFFGTDLADLCAVRGCECDLCVLLTKFCTARRQQSLASDYRHLLCRALKLYVYSTADFHPSCLRAQSGESSNVIREGRFKRTIISGESAKEFFTQSCAASFSQGSGERKS